MQYCLYYSKSLYKAIKGVHGGTASFLGLNGYRKEGNEVLPVLAVFGARYLGPLFWPLTHFAWAESPYRSVSGVKYRQPRG